LYFYASQYKNKRSDSRRSKPRKGGTVGLEQNTHLVSTRVPTDVYQAMVNDAAALGVSIAAVLRLYCKTGRLPKLPEVQR
jgi:hypothetical protein